VFAQVLAEDADGTVREARGYQDWADNVVAKIPATRAGAVTALTGPEALRQFHDDIPRLS